MIFRRRVLRIACLCSLLLGAAGAGAQDFPTKPIRIIVPTTPGGLGDTVPRILAPAMGKFLGQAIVIENKPGANQMIGYEYVARQVPGDGYTLVAVTVPNLVTLPATIKDLRFDPLKDLQPVIGIAEARLALVSSATLPWKSFAEMVSHAKVNPGKLNYGSASPVILMQTGGLVRDLSLTVTHVPYSTTANFILGIVRADVHMGFISESALAPVADKLNVLAITGKPRTAALPNVPTFAELNYPQMRGVSYALKAPGSTPRAIIDKLHGAAARALNEPDIRAQFQKARVDIVQQSPDVAAKNIADESRFFLDIARRIGVKAE